jgi:hypothetical protein
MMLILVPAFNVNEAGFNSEVVAANVAPAGTIAVAPLTSTHTSFGEYLNDTTHIGKFEGTVVLAAVLAAIVALNLFVLGYGA